MHALNGRSSAPTQQQCLQERNCPKIPALPLRPQRTLQYRQQQVHGHKRARTVQVRAAAVEAEEDLEQFADRENWYRATFCADDAPDWNPGAFLRSTQVTPSLRNVVFEAEISREKIPLRNAYRHVGQRASVRINGVEHELTVACAPFPQKLNKSSLYKVRGDLTAGETKTVKEEISVRAELHVLVSKDDAEDVYNATEGDSVEIGPFKGNGIDLRGAIAGIYAYPTIVIFCEGRGIADARALIEATPDVGGLSFNNRQDVRMYYRAPNEEALAFRSLYQEWEQQYHCKVITSTRGTFEDMFDDDDTLMYEPSTTAAIILTGGDEEAEAAALAVCKEAEIEEIARGSVQQTRTMYLEKGKPTDDQ
ncbi:hypothetical protein WJX72_010528 [[Myrmecia] bisecta]|uniref:FAD-binding FR-type domain-containing protein n=1 Tax=[Myrmecia] bisecta TaxID=41462 RepID=A0AAW1Q4A6_9CHLO